MMPLWCHLIGASQHWAAPVGVDGMKRYLRTCPSIVLDARASSGRLIAGGSVWDLGDLLSPLAPKLRPF
jgi:hypothetical protein